MYRNDWLMQQFEDAAACLAAVFGHRVAGQPAEARIELDGAALRLLGIDPATLSLFSVARARSRRFAEAAWTARPELRQEPTLGEAAWKARFG